MRIIDQILNKNMTGLYESLDSELSERIQLRIIDLKKNIQAEHYSIPLDEETDLVFEAGRFRIIRAKVRKGKVLRRHKEATRKGFTMRGGKVTKMSPRETLNRRRSQRKARIKRRAKKNIAKRKTKKALRLRRQIGLK